MQLASGLDVLKLSLVFWHGLNDGPVLESPLDFPTVASSKPWNSELKSPAKRQTNCKCADQKLRHKKIAVLGAGCLALSKFATSLILQGKSKSGNIETWADLCFPFMLPVSPRSIFSIKFLMSPALQPKNGALQLHGWCIPIRCAWWAQSPLGFCNNHNWLRLCRLRAWGSSIPLYIWLVVSTPLKSMKVDWDDYYQCMGIEK